MHSYTNVLQKAYILSFSLQNIYSKSNTELVVLCHVFQNRMGVNYWIVYPRALCAELIFFFFRILKFPKKSVPSQRDWNCVSEANFLQHFCILKSHWQEIISLRDTTKLELKSSRISHFLVCEWLFPIHPVLNCVAQPSFQMTSEPLKNLSDRGEQCSNRNMSQQQKKFINLQNI